MNNNERLEPITSKNIDNFTTADVEEILKRTKLNKDGYPLIWPSKNQIGKRIVISFYKVTIDGDDEYKEPVSFDIYDDEKFDRNAKDAVAKVKFLSAYLSNNKSLSGAVYWKGVLSNKLDSKTKKRFFKNLMTKYFHIEDADLIEKYFEPLEGTHIPYWPNSYYDGKEVIFAAVHANLAATSNPKEFVEKDINFTVCKGDLFDLKKSEDLRKVKIVHDMLDTNRLVYGFYYKGQLLPLYLNKKFKLYLEKSFIKKNFCVEDKEFLLTYITRGTKENLPLYWPMNDKKGRPIVVSVLNANGAGIDPKYANFDLYSDEPLNLNAEDVKAKLSIVQELLSGKKLISGVLYLDGMLIPGVESKSEIERRVGKVEKALNVYISTNEDFIRISNSFTIEDREKLLRLGDQYNEYFTDNFTKVPGRYTPENGEVPELHFERVNVLDELGNYILAEDLTLDVTGDKYNDKNVVEVFKHMANPHTKVRGGVYYKGKNVNFPSVNSFGRKVNKESFLHFVYSKVNAETLEQIKKFASEPKYKFNIDSVSKLPKFWATKNKDGREVLLSVVDSDIHFKVGRYTVKACNNINFDVYTGETLGLVGESGSGKTTITRAILGINKLTKGGIYYKGKLISGKMKRKEAHTMKKNIQMVFQDPAASLNERANIDYIVSEGLYNFKLFKTKEERIEKVTNMMREVGLLPEHLSRYPHEFSGGQRQRIGIARALIIEPQLVLADEPISALDVSIRAQILNLLRRLQKANDITYVFIAHDLSIIRYISDRIAVMHKGYIVELGPAEEIYSNPLHPYTRSLLTAIPQPDPKTKNERKKVPYNQGDIVYGECTWEEFRPQHYVLVNDRLREDVKKRVAKINDNAVTEVKKTSETKKTAAKKTSTSKASAPKKEASISKKKTTKEEATK